MTLARSRASAACQPLTCQRASTLRNFQQKGTLSCEILENPLGRLGS